MDNFDPALLESALQESFQIKRLYERHRSLDKLIADFESRRFLTGQEELQVKELKKLKLRGKEELIKLINQYKLLRENHA